MIKKFNNFITEKYESILDINDIENLFIKLNDNDVDFNISDYIDCTNEIFHYKIGYTISFTIIVK
jgi:hypothetical protein